MTSRWSVARSGRGYSADGGRHQGSGAKPALLSGAGADAGAHIRSAPAPALQIQRGADLGRALLRHSGGRLLLSRGGKRQAWSLGYCPKPRGILYVHKPAEQLCFSMDIQIFWTFWGVCTVFGKKILFL